jgi:hypothetical protein
MHHGVLPGAHGNAHDVPGRGPPLHLLDDVRVPKKSGVRSGGAAASDAIKRSSEVTETANEAGEFFPGNFEFHERLLPPTF